MQMQMPAPGDLFEGRYQIVQHLGRGAFGEVFLARDASVGRDVAIKCLAAGAERYAERAVARFDAEARVVATLQHPNTVRLFEYGEATDGLLYMVFEYVRGVDLASSIAQGVRFDPDQTLHIVGQLLDALVEAHHVGVLHRDIKPANIVLYEYAGDTMRAKLLDFGIAKLMDGDPKQPGLTRTGVAIGTPRYMAPEQTCGDPLGTYTDVFSLGLVAVELLAGRAFLDTWKAACLRCYLDPDFPPPQLPGDIAPPLVRDLLRMMCDGSLQRRFPTAVAAKRVIEGFRRSPAAAPPLPTTPPVARPVAAIVVGIAAFGAVLAVLFAVSSREPEMTPPVARRATEIPAATIAATDTSVASELAVLRPPEGCATDNVGRGFMRLRSLVSLDDGHSSAFVYVPKSYDPMLRNRTMLVFPNDKETSEQAVSQLGLRKFAEQRGVVLLLQRNVLFGFDEKPDPLRRERLAAEQLQVARKRLCLDEHNVIVYGHGRGARPALRLGCHLPGVAGIATSASLLAPGEHPCRDRPVPTLYLGNVNRDAPKPGRAGGGYLKGCDFADANFGFKRNKGSRSHVVMTPAEQVESFTSAHVCDPAPVTVWTDDASSLCLEWSCEVPLRTCHFNVSQYADRSSDWQKAAVFRPCDWRPPELDYATQLIEFFGEPRGDVDGDAGARD